MGRLCCCRFLLRLAIILLWEWQSAALNLYDSDDDTWWQSLSEFEPVQSASYGSLTLRDSMYMEFDVVFHGPTPAPDIWQNVFRIGLPSTIGDCYGQSSRYPSLWMYPSRDFFYFSVSDSDDCTTAYPFLTATHDLTFSVIIHYNSTRITIEYKTALSTNYITLVDTTRNSTLPSLVDRNNPTSVYVFMSTDEYAKNRPTPPANVTLSNIRIVSYWYSDGFTLPPTAAPTKQPTQSPTQLPTLLPTMPSLRPTDAPTSNPTQSPTIVPTDLPTDNPTMTPTQTPTALPSPNPTSHPSQSPTVTITTTTTSTTTTAVALTEAVAIATNSSSAQESLEDEVVLPDSTVALNSLLSQNVIYILIAVIACLSTCCCVFCVYMVFYARMFKPPEAEKEGQDDTDVTDDEDEDDEDDDGDEEEQEAVHGPLDDDDDDDDDENDGVVAVPSGDGGSSGGRGSLHWAIPIKRNRAKKSKKRSKARRSREAGAPRRAYDFEYDDADVDDHQDGGSHSSLTYHTDSDPLHAQKAKSKSKSGKSKGKQKQKRKAKKAKKHKKTAATQPVAADPEEQAMFDYNSEDSRSPSSEEHVHQRERDWQIRKQQLRLHQQRFAPNNATEMYKVDTGSEMFNDEADHSEETEDERPDDSAAGHQDENEDDDGHRREEVVLAHAAEADDAHSDRDDQHDEDEYLDEDTDHAHEDRDEQHDSHEKDQEDEDEAAEQANDADVAAARKHGDQKEESDHVHDDEDEDEMDEFAVADSKAEGDLGNITMLFHGHGGMGVNRMTLEDALDDGLSIVPSSGQYEHSEISDRTGRTRTASEPVPGSLISQSTLSTTYKPNKRTNYKAHASRSSQSHSPSHSHSHDAFSAIDEEKETSSRHDDMPLSTHVQTTQPAHNINSDPEAAPSWNQSVADEIGLRERLPLDVKGSGTSTMSTTSQSMSGDQTVPPLPDTAAAYVRNHNPHHRPNPYAPANMATMADMGQGQFASTPSATDELEQYENTSLPVTSSQSSDNSQKTRSQSRQKRNKSSKKLVNRNGNPFIPKEELEEMHLDDDDEDEDGDDDIDDGQEEQEDDEEQDAHDDVIGDDSYIPSNLHSDAVWNQQQNILLALQKAPGLPQKPKLKKSQSSIANRRKESGKQKRSQPYAHYME